MRQLSFDPPFFALGVIAVLFVLFCVSILSPSASAYSISSMNITPQENILSGQTITTSFTFTPSVYEFYTSNPNITITIRTGLTDVKWYRETYIDGYSSFQNIPGQIVYLQGWDLAYPLNAGETINEKINFVMTGIAPNVSKTSEVPLIQIKQYDRAGQEIKAESQTFNILVIHKNDLAAGILIAQHDLDKFYANILKISAKGIDTSPAKSIYVNAVTSLDIAKNLPADQYPLALTRLDEVNQAIYQGENLLDQEWAQSEMDKASVPVIKLNLITGWFTGNNSTAEYPGLNVILSEQNDTLSHLNSMNSAFYIEKNYTKARDEAKITFKIANESLPEAQLLQRRAMDPLTILWDNLLVIGILAIGGIFYLLFRPKKKKPIKEVKNDDKPE